MLRIVAISDRGAILRAIMFGFLHRAHPEQCHRAERRRVHLGPTDQLAFLGVRDDKPLVPEKLAFIGYIILHAGHWRYRQIEPMPVKRGTKRVGRAFHEPQTHQWRLGGKGRHADAEGTAE